MKTTIALVAGLAALFVAAPSASAKGRKGHVKIDRKARILAKYDTNHDGTLSKEEIAVMKPKLAAKILKGDADKDGSVSASEFSTLKFKAHKHGKKKS